MKPKIITHNDGRTMVVGSRYHRRVRGPMLHVGNYLGRTLPDPPAKTDYWTAAAPFLKKMLLNDALGDCTVAAALHIGGSWLANVGEPISFGDHAALWLYEHACGYVDGDPNTDQGGNEQDVLNYIQQHGFESDGAHKIAGWAAIDATDYTEVEQAIYLFENAYLGMALPDAWVEGMKTMKDGDTWDEAGEPNQQNGHAVPIIDYDDDTIPSFWISTWGFKIRLTPRALAKYATPSNYGEAYTLFGPDSISRATGKSPAGFDASQLLADLQAITATPPPANTGVKL